jgi:hypothetical protein
VIEAFPLYWPEGWPRTKYRVQSAFKTGFGAARNFLFDEIRRMGGSKPILSTNIPLRNDGLPRANMPNPSDPGGAVYFTYKKHDLVFACDKYRAVTDNIYAIAKTIDAMRGIERWGASDMMERAFTGFKALPEKGSQSWRDILGIPRDQFVNRQVIEDRFRELAKVRHPDMTGGSADEFQKLLEARAAARLEVA